MQHAWMEATRQMLTKTGLTVGMYLLMPYWDVVDAFLVALVIVEFITAILIHHYQPKKWQIICSREPINLYQRKRQEGEEEEKNQKRD